MGRSQLLVYYYIFASTICWAKLPPSFKTCDIRKPDFKTCEPEAVQDAMRQLTRPFKELGLPSLSPLKVPSLTVGEGTRAVSLRQVFRNIDIYGINNVDCFKMDVNFKAKTIENLCAYPEIRMESDYEANGKILVLDVYGSGRSTIVLEKVKISVKYKVEEYQKQGRKHFNVTDIDLQLQPERVRFQFENLFNGDKLLSDNIHQVINENWKAVFDDVVTSYNDAFGQITKNIFNTVLARVPVSEMFGTEE